MSRVLWKAIDGREFIIDTVKENINSSEELKKHIQKLREEHGYDTPDAMHAIAAPGTNLQSLVGNVVDINDLPEKLKAEVEKAIIANIKPDPKTLN